MDPWAVGERCAEGGLSRIFGLSVPKKFNFQNQTSTNIYGRFPDFAQNDKSV
jgi:hypothetical protein